MISNTLFEAGEKIREYLRRYPHYYADIRPEIDALVASMDAVRVRLDAPPLAGVPDEGEHKDDEPPMTEEV